MRFSTFIASSVLAVLSVNAQNTTVAPVSSSVALNPAQSSQASCLSACDPKNPTCRQACIVTPQGDYSTQNRTVECVASCVQGDGTSAANAVYAACYKGCLASASVTSSSTAAPGVTETGTGTATGTGSASGKVTGTGTASGGKETASGTSDGSRATGTSSSATTTSKAAADTIRMGVSLTGVLGGFAAIFAL